MLSQGGRPSLYSCAPDSFSSGHTLDPPHVKPPGEPTRCNLPHQRHQRCRCERTLGARSSGAPHLHSAHPYAPCSCSARSSLRLHRCAVAFWRLAARVLPPRLRVFRPPDPKPSTDRAIRAEASAPTARSLRIRTLFRHSGCRFSWPPAIPARRRNRPRRHRCRRPARRRRRPHRPHHRPRSSAPKSR